MEQHSFKKKNPIELIAPAIGTPFFIWAIVHAIRTRTLEDFIRYSGYTAALMAVGGLIILLLLWKDEGFRRPSLEEVLLILFMPLGLVLIGAIYYAVGAALKDAYLWLRALPSGTLAIFLTMLTTLLSGLALFYFRLHLRSVYGLTETLVGLAVAAYRVSTTDNTGYADPGLYLVILTAGVYLVVRGLDNVREGLTKSPPDPIATAMIAYFKDVSFRAKAGRPSERVEPQSQ